MANQIENYTNVEYGLSMMSDGATYPAGIKWDGSAPNRPTEQEMIDMALAIRALPNVFNVFLGKTTIAQTSVTVDLDATTPNFNNP